MYCEIFCCPSKIYSVNFPLEIRVFLCQIAFYKCNALIFKSFLVNMRIPVTILAALMLLTGEFRNLFSESETYIISFA